MIATLPIFYLCILTIFLFTLSWLISQQLRTAFLLESQFRYFLDKSKNGILDIQENVAFAKVCVAKKYFTRAIVQSQQALKYNSLFGSQENANLYNMLGFIYHEANQKNFAKDFYKKAIEIDPEYVTALNNLAKIYEDTNEIRKAIILYNKVLNIDSNNKIASDKINFIKKSYNM